jgi:hypothetical protein
MPATILPFEPRRTGQPKEPQALPAPEPPSAMPMPHAAPLSGVPRFPMAGPSTSRKIAHRWAMLSHLARRYPPRPRDPIR